MKKTVIATLLVSSLGLVIPSAYAQTNTDKVSAWTQLINMFMGSGQQRQQQQVPQGQPRSVYVVPQSNAPQIIQYQQVQVPNYYQGQNGVYQGQNLNTEVTNPTSIFGNQRPQQDITKNYTPGANPGYKWPVAETNGGVSNTVVSPWGPRCHIHPDGTEFCGDDSTMHNGIDINVPVGTKVSSMTSGKVAWVDPYCNDRSQTMPPQGCSVSVVNDKGEMFTYMHLNKTGLKTGDQIGEGNDIGESGNTGKSTGAHLHLAACEVDTTKVTGKSYPMSLCKPENGGKSINPLDKLDPKDNRSVAGRKLEKLRDEYHKCLKDARANKDTAKAAECKKAYAQRRAMPKSEDKPIDTRQSKSAVF